MPKRRSTNCCCNCESGVDVAAFWAIVSDDKCAKAKISRQTVSFLFMPKAIKFTKTVCNGINIIFDYKFPVKPLLLHKPNYNNGKFRLKN